MCGEKRRQRSVLPVTFRCPQPWQSYSMSPSTFLFITLTPFPITPVRPQTCSLWVDVLEPRRYQHHNVHERVRIQGHGLSHATTITSALRTCRQCKQRFDTELNHAAACHYHPESFTGDSKRKIVWQSREQGYASGDGSVERFWWFVFPILPRFSQIFIQNICKLDLLNDYLLFPLFVHVTVLFLCQVLWAS